MLSVLQQMGGDVVVSARFQTWLASCRSNIFYMRMTVKFKAIAQRTPTYM
jgi:hypothetical protein